MQKFKIDLAVKDRDRLLLAFPGRDLKARKSINVSRLYDQKYNQMLKKLYKRVDVHENDGADDPVDQSGYTGQFYRPVNNHLEPISEAELIRIIHKDNKLKEVVRPIYEIDKQRNGFITTTELDDILKLNYKNELENKDLKLMMRKYASIQNRVLVDYKRFRDNIIEQLKILDDHKKQSALALAEEKSRLKLSSASAKRISETLNNILKSRGENLE